MIYQTEQQAIEAAAEHIRLGRVVAYCFSRNARWTSYAQIMAKVAALVPGAVVKNGWVILDGRAVGLPRVPFDQGSGIQGWKGAVVISPDVPDALSFRQFECVLADARRIHQEAGITA